MASGYHGAPGYRGIQYILHHSIEDLTQIELANLAQLIAAAIDRDVTDWWGGNFYTSDAAQQNRERMSKNIRTLEQIAHRLRVLSGVE